VAEVAANAAALSLLQPAWLLAWRVTRCGTPDPGMASCGLARCGRGCGSALGGRPHGIRLNRVQTDARVAPRVERGKPPSPIG
jgi:hypothetical protein